MGLLGTGRSPISPKSGLQSILGMGFGCIGPVIAVEFCPMGLWCCADESIENSKSEVRSQRRGLPSVLLMLLGFRIAPEEVETLIVNVSPSVTAASVHLSEDGLSLIAFVVCNRSFKTDILGDLKGNMPGYMLPSKVHILDRLPTNANDKVDHKMIALKRHELSQSTKKESNGIIPQDAGRPESSVESEELVNHLGKIWQDTLRLEEMPRQDINFFDIGGHRYLCRPNTLYSSEKIY